MSIYSIFSCSRHAEQATVNNKRGTANRQKGEFMTNRSFAENKKVLDKIRGSLFGGAVGDALGYPVEFLPWGRIQKNYGKQGITSYELDPESGTALISDDTQMALFTANGILSA